MNATQATLSVRAATGGDIPRKAQIEEFAVTPLFPASLWTPIVALSGTAQGFEPLLSYQAATFHGAFPRETTYRKQLGGI